MESGMKNVKSGENLVTLCSAQLIDYLATLMQYKESK
jgi:hypothetical protein